MKRAGCEYHQRNLIALLEGAADSAVCVETLHHLESCPVCRAEYEWLRTVSRDLETIGAAVNRTVPEVNLVAGVTARIAAVAPRTEDLTGKVKPRWTIAWYAGLVSLVAATVIAGLWFIFEPLRPAPILPPLARNVDHPGLRSSVAPPPSDAAKRRQASLKKLLAALDRLPKQSKTLAHPKNVLKKAAPSDLRSLTTDDILKTRKAAVTDPEARDRLVRWASLTPEQAQKVVSAPNASPGAVVGATASLDPTVAAPLLLTAISAYPDRPSVRMALTKTYEADPETSADAVAAADDWIASDPTNAAAYCWKAMLLLQQPQPDTQGALDLLKAARKLPTASAYGLDFANFNADALIASGMAPDTARALCALTAGHAQHQFLDQLGTGLLNQAKQSFNQGDPATARSIAEAVQQFGKQVSQGAQLTQERLAGLDIQSSAISVLQSIYTAVGSVTDIQQLTVDASHLATGLQNFGNFLNNLSDLFLGATNQMLNTISNVVLQTGDLTLLNHLGN